jgi:Uma2 family endonuclease
MNWEELPTPILVVEVVSLDTAKRDALVKRDLYQRQAVGEYWIVDGETRTIRVVTTASDRVETQTLRWHPAPAPVPLDIDLRRLFESALGAL